MNHVKYILIISLILCLPVVSFAQAEYGQLEDILMDYRLKGDAYEEYGHPYMAFLNYDKANWQSGKDVNFNKVEDYKNYLKLAEKNIEQYGGGNFAPIINKSFEVADYHTTLKYSIIAEQNNPHNGKAYDRKVSALLFLQKPNAALNAFEKLVMTESSFSQWSSAHIGRKLDLLYATEMYGDVIKLYELWKERSLEKGGNGLPPASSSMTIAMAYEKLGNSKEAKYWYEQSSSEYFDTECLKANKLFSIGLYEEVVMIIESNDTFKQCTTGSLYPYVIAKDIVTGQYVPPVKHNEDLEIPNESKSTSLVCALGIELNNGFCVYPKYSTSNDYGFPFDADKGIEYYLTRYYNEIEYRQWFKNNFPELTIEEAIGLVQPFEKIKASAEKCPQNVRGNYDQLLRNYVSRGGSSIGAEQKIGSYTDHLVSCIGASGITELNDVGILLAERGQYQDSLFYFDRALEIYPDYAIAIANKASVLAEMGKINEATTLFDKSIQLYPEEEEIKELKKYFIDLQDDSVNDIMCGKGTIPKDGQCILDPNYKPVQTSSRGGGCLIATATYGSELTPQVQQLRELRDSKLLQTESGTSFMESFNSFYYSFSPYIADYERENPAFKEAVKLFITPMIASLSILNHVDMNSEVEVLGYGISLIVLNVGMYVGIPAFAIISIRKKF